MEKKGRNVYVGPFATRVAQCVNDLNTVVQSATASLRKIEACSEHQLRLLLLPTRILLNTLTEVRRIVSTRSQTLDASGVTDSCDKLRTVLILYEDYVAALGEVEAGIYRVYARLRTKEGDPSQRRKSSYGLNADGTQATEKENDDEAGGLMKTIREPVEHVTLLKNALKDLCEQTRAKTNARVGCVGMLSSDHEQWQTAATALDNALKSAEDTETRVKTILTNRVASMRVARLKKTIGTKFNSLFNGERELLADGNVYIATAKTPVLGSYGVSSPCTGSQDSCHRLVLFNDCFLAFTPAELAQGQVVPIPLDFQGIKLSTLQALTPHCGRNSAFELVFHVPTTYGAATGATTAEDKDKASTSAAAPAAANAEADNGDDDDEDDKNNKGGKKKPGKKARKNLKKKVSGGSPLQGGQTQSDAAAAPAKLALNEPEQKPVELQTPGSVRVLMWCDKDEEREAWLHAFRAAMELTTRAKINAQHIHDAEAKAAEAEAAEAKTGNAPKSPEECHLCANAMTHSMKTELHANSPLASWGMQDAVRVLANWQFDEKVKTSCTGCAAEQTAARRCCGYCGAMGCGSFLTNIGFLTLRQTYARMCSTCYAHTKKVVDDHKAGYDQAARTILKWYRALARRQGFRALVNNVPRDKSASTVFVTFHSWDINRSLGTQVPPGMHLQVPPGVTMGASGANPATPPPISTAAQFVLAPGQQKPHIKASKPIGRYIILTTTDRNSRQITSRVSKYLDAFEEHLELDDMTFEVTVPFDGQIAITIMDLVDNETRASRFIGQAVCQVPSRAEQTVTKGVSLTKMRVVPRQLAGGSTDERILRRIQQQRPHFSGTVTCTITTEKPEPPKGLVRACF
eukprot:TRINITY_DN1948_c0_g1::TRINITY_DN1948_c0_g1_i2::g.22970::m.22970 TRINITY_DN1948_c0_g1::TRINITY_DN1948_c0_g1_i2::g.22970  ORF type:complete len:876 (-),score=320.81,RNase_H2-Ydr279/PF09468.5/1.9e+03,RNase_H2-Ydr279/PF09468.5/1.1,DZR/PF12773.2/3.4,DZR/PF12773.2/2.1e+02,PGA2/PF07543.7/0.92,PGA2/PF07543.7/4.9e+02 TRINITY_DN1948_c0_g1_i2:63-2639(-)